MKVGGSFERLFQEARKTDEYWAAQALEELLEGLDKLSKREGVSRSELARRLGVSPAYITKLFRGDGNPTIATMVKLARALEGRVTITVTPVTEQVCWYGALSEHARHPTMSTTRIVPTTSSTPVEKGPHDEDAPLAA